MLPILTGPLSGLSTVGQLRDRTGLADLQPKRSDQSTIAQKSNNPETEVDDLRLGEVFAQFVEQVFRCLRMVASQHVRVMDGGLFLGTKALAICVIGNVRDIRFRQTITLCNCKARV